MTINELKTMIKRYKDNDAWKKNTYFSEKEFNHLQDIMIEAKELDKKVEELRRERITQEDSKALTCLRRYFQKYSTNASSISS